MSTSYTAIHLIALPKTLLHRLHSQGIRAVRLVGNVYTREATDYRRHYTTSYTDVIVLNQLRPREFLFKVFFNI